jgi:hypothetical protein
LLNRIYLGTDSRCHAKFIEQNAFPYLTLPPDMISQSDKSLYA